MPEFPLSILVGETAYRTLSDRGWDPVIFDTIVGASGGAKLLGLTHLDRFLFSDYLQRTSHPMELYGSSIGSWRHAALASSEPLSAITKLQERYLNQTWDENDDRHPSDIVDGLCEWVVDGFCTPGLIENLCHHPRFTTHIVTARGLGLNSRARSVALGIGMGTAAVGNLINRRLLASGFQRVVFSTGDAKSFEFSDFDTLHVPLNPSGLKQALLASGSIPFLMSGIRNPPAAPSGMYWDGGIIDYHFDFNNHAGDGLVLYPHFNTKVITGWFDKALPWRVNKTRQLDRVVLLAPSPSYIARLPGGKIPDRKDFTRYPNDVRLDYWQTAMAMSQELADAFSKVLDDPDPVRYLTRLATG